MAEDLRRAGESNWIFEAAEFPVRVRGEDTRIDFVLRLRKVPIYMVAECKRADPKFANWCFVRAPYVRRGQRMNVFWLDCVRYVDDVCQVIGEELSELDEKKAFHIGLPMKSRDPKGDSSNSRNAIEDAVAQVCRGLNGIIEILTSKKELLSQERTRIFPVIFTTARLWTSECELSSAKIEDGTLELPEEDLCEQDWIYYQYHMSPGLKHSAPLGQHPTRLWELLGYEYIRTIPVVTAGAIESFLKCFDPGSW